jgi:hypothetical protein
MKTEEKRKDKENLRKNCMRKGKRKALPPRYWFIRSKRLSIMAGRKDYFYGGLD